MEYLLAFLEGIITFISPCLLPMLPIYISYFAGQNSEGQGSAAVKNALGFVSGFTLVFVILGALAGSAGYIFSEYETTVNIVTGVIVILFGLNFLGVLRLPFMNNHRLVRLQTKKTGFLSAVLFGIVFSIGWTPCVGAFLGSALMLAASGGESLRGILMLLCFSVGLGIPFLASAVLLERLKSTIEFIKRNYHIINMISGALLIIIGILMATGLMGYYLSLLTF